MLVMNPNMETKEVTFEVEYGVPSRGGNTAQRREHDKQVASGTMSRAGAKCPCCPTIMTMEDIRVEAKSGKLGAQLTAVAVDGQKGKEYRLPTEAEKQCAAGAENDIDSVYKNIPYGIPNEPTPSGGGRGAGRAFSVQNYGLMHWCDLFTQRQLVALGHLIHSIRDVRNILNDSDNLSTWEEAVQAYLSASLNRLVDQSTTLCTWYLPGENVKHTYVRYALPIMWDYAEANPMFEGGGSWSSAIRLCTYALDHALVTAKNACAPNVVRSSSTSATMPQDVDLVITDPPYYDAIPYSDLMDLFYIWLRRTMADVSTAYTPLKDMSLSPKWDSKNNDGELIDDESRHNGDGPVSRKSYEDGMFRVFERCNSILKNNGRMVVVFAHKDPLAWETLAAAMIRAGFVVDASWPIQTENATRSRARASAALASSLWLVCKKRPVTARPGWDNNVLEEMKVNIAIKLQEYWDAGIRGPDFVWAATGPAMEAYSKHPVVRKANEPNATMDVGEFLNHVRRMVVDYVVGRVLTASEGDQGSDLSAADRLDEVTAYYLLHRNDFGMDEAPVGACILYATACGLSDSELDKTWDVLSHVGSKDAQDEDTDNSDDSDDGDSEADDTSSSGGSKVKLKAWNQRRGKSMGLEAPEGKAVPLIDRIHRVMHLWKEGDLQKVDEFLDQHALRRSELFKRVVQSLIELSPPGSSGSSGNERSLLESISNHIGAKGVVKDRGPILFEEAGDA
jgi:adenine-specific DNA methylase